MNTLLILFILASFFYSKSFANEIEYSSKSKNTTIQYEEALKYLDKKKYNQVNSILKKIIKEEPTFLEAKLLFAKLNQKLGNFKECITVLNNLNKLGIKSNEFNFEVSFLYYRCGYYKHAYKVLKKTVKITKQHPLYEKKQLLLKNIQFSIKAKKNAYRFKPKLLKSPLNNLAAQYFPILSIDQTKLYFTGKKKSTYSSQECIYVSTKNKNGNWSEPELFSKNINEKTKEGACTLSADGNILIFGVYNRKENYGRCDLYISYKKNGKWTNASNMGPNINSNGWQSQPCLTADGKTLFFTSKRKENFGKKDIWVSTFKNNQWTKAQNLGNEINSEGNEISPFIHPNGKILYFASDREPSLGGFDLYYSQLIDNKWTVPKNLGYPINNHKDQVSLFVTADGEKGYYSAGTQKGIHYNGKLYVFDIPKDLKPFPICTYIKGIIEAENKVSKETIIDGFIISALSNNNDEKLTKSPTTFSKEKTKIYVFDAEDAENFFITEIDPDYNNFCIPLKNGSNYKLFFSKKDHMVKYLEVDLKSTKPIKGFEKNISLEQLKNEQRLYFNNILFDFDKCDIKKSSEIELQALIIFLKDNPNVSVIIEGYTDKVGNEEYNLNLSEKRAKAVYDYLIKHKIMSERLKYVGLGKSKNKLKNEDEEKLDRKVTFKILYIK